MADNNDHWHLDKRVPIALIFAIFVQTSGAIWWASSISNRVTVNEASITRLATQTDGLRNAASLQAVQLGRIEEQIAGLRSDIARMIEALDRQR